MNSMNSWQDYKNPNETVVRFSPVLSVTGVITPTTDDMEDEVSVFPSLALIESFLHWNANDYSGTSLCKNL
jgi:hypothetical protein